MQVKDFRKSERYIGRNSGSRIQVENNMKLGRYR